VCPFDIESWDNIVFHSCDFYYFKKYIFGIVKEWVRVYSLSNGDEDEKKKFIAIGYDNGVGNEFYYGDGNGIVKLTSASPCCHP